MATVYLAHDLKHDRDVAIKVLRPDIAAVIGADRFLAEIHTTAKLQHPHILPLFDSGVEGGFLYYVMPYLEGGSLRELLERTSPMPVGEVARMIAEVGAALDYAHRCGVIHRDIKPANIVLHDGSALLADFGIARAVTASGEDRLTETGLSVGTPQYMSPEQAAGEREIGPASDLFSLGVVAYEMLSGTVPFRGPTVQAVVAQLFTATPEPLHDTVPGIPELVDAAVLKSLEKLPEDRFASGSAFASAIKAGVEQPTVRVFAPPPRSFARWWRPLAAVGAVGLVLVAWRIARGSGGEGASDTPRLLAVLPFENDTPDPTKEVFGRGLAVEITDELHHLGVGVVGSSAVALAARRFRSNDGVDLQATGGAVGADAVLVGTILPDSGGVRLSLQLTDVKRQVVLWSENFPLGGDLFTVQDAVARRVSQALRVTLTPVQLAEVRRGRSVDPVAQELVVRARGYVEQRRGQDLEQANGLYEQALRRDSTYADAWAGLAEVNNLRAVFSAVHPEPYFRLATVAADRALALDSSSATAHRALGFLAVFFTHDWDRAGLEFRRALELDSLSPETWLFRSWLFSALRQPDSMLASIRRARALDSLTTIYPLRLGDILYLTGHDTAAKRELLGAFRRDPSNPYIRMSLAAVYARLGQCDSALATPTDSIASNHGNYPFLIRTWARCGHPEQIRAFVRDEQRRETGDSLASGVILALAYSYLGDREGVIRSLDYAVRTDDWQLFFVNTDPEFDPYRDDPAFRAILRRMRMPGG